MKNQRQDVKPDSSQREPYEKPQVQPYRLATEELAATGCKLVNIPMGPATGCAGKYGVCREVGS